METVDDKTREQIMNLIGAKEVTIVDLMYAHRHLLSIAKPSAKMKECIQHVETAIHSNIIAIKHRPYPRS